MTSSIPHPLAFLVQPDGRPTPEWYNALRSVITSVNEAEEDEPVIPPTTPWVTPEMFGAVGDLLPNYSNISTATDNTSAFNDLAAYINSAGGGIQVFFSPGAIYKIWPNGTAASALCTISGVNGVTLHGNGAKFYTNASAADLGSNTQVFLVLNTLGFQASDLTYEQSYTTLDPSSGAVFFYLQGATEGVRILNCRQTGGIGFITCNLVGGVASGLARVRDVVFSGSINNVYYGLTCGLSGDQVRGHLRTRNGGRAAIVYNVSEVDLVIESNHGGPFDDIEIVAYGHPSLQVFETTTSDISIQYITKYRYPGAAITSNGSVCRMAFAQLDATPTAAYMRNIKVSVDVTVAADVHAPIFKLTKSSLSGVDPVARGHRLDNVVLSGYVSGQMTNNLIEIGTVASTSNMAGEAVRNFVIRDLVADGCTTDINIDASSFTSLILENISAANCDINITNDGAGVLKKVGFGLSDTLTW